MEILTELFISRLKKREGLEDMAKKQCRLDIRTCLFSQRTVNEWNILSADYVGASNVNMFRNKIDIYLRRAGYI